MSVFLKYSGVSIITIVIIIVIIIIIIINIIIINNKGIKTKKEKEQKMRARIYKNIDCNEKREWREEKSWN